MRILVTGGAGYVGTRLSNALVRAGHPVRVLDALLYGSQGVRPEIDLRRGDLRSRSDLARALEGVDVVFHLASSTGVLREASATPAAEIESVLSEAQRRNVRRFIYGSALDPSGRHDRAVEQCVVEANSAAFEATCVRMASVCGPSPRQRFDLGANAMAGSAWFDGRIEIPADDVTVAHLTMTDAVRLYLTLLEARGPDIGGRIFEAGYEAMNSRELAELIRDRVPTPNGVPAAIEVSLEAGRFQAASRFDAAPLEAILGFRPQASVREMVDQLVQLIELGFLDRYDRDIYHNEPVRPAPIAPSRTARLLERAARAFPASL